MAEETTPPTQPIETPDEPKVKTKNHKIKEGDTIESVADEHKLPWKLLFLANRDALVFSDTQLTVGDTLKIPVAE